MRNKNSFTSQVKEELASNNYPSEDRLRALLSAYIRINGSLVFRHKKTLLQLNTENAKIGRFIYETINEIYWLFKEIINWFNYCCYSINCLYSFYKCCD